jgi:hypothetical protein
MDDIELPDGRNVRITDRALEHLDDHDGCPLCLGRAAAHRGNGDDTNPFTDVPDVMEMAGSPTEGESSLGCSVPDGEAGIENPL